MPLHLEGCPLIFEAEGRGEVEASDILLDIYCTWHVLWISDITNVSDLFGARFHGVYTYCADSLPYFTVIVN